MQLEVSHVSHAYDDLVVLDDVSFTVADGEILALIGPSGCGKSTLLGIAGGLLAPTGGTVAIQIAIINSNISIDIINKNEHIVSWSTQI